MRQVKHPRPGAPSKVTMLVGNNGVMLRLRDKQTMEDAIVLSLGNDEQTVRVQIAGDGIYDMSGYPPVVSWVKCVVELMHHNQTMRFCGEQIRDITEFITQYGTPVEGAA